MKNKLFLIFITGLNFLAYASNGPDWTEIGSATAMTGVALNDQAGYSVAISSDGTIVAVGEPRWNGVGSDSGRVRVYSYNGSDWTEIGSPTAMTGATISDQAGTSVAISSDGTIVAVGEPRWNGVGADSGRVRVYQYTAGNWTEIGSPTAMTGVAANDQAGASIAISSDGTIVAVGEPQWDGVGGNSGRVRVYQYTAGNWTEVGSPTAMTGENASDNAGFSVAMSSDGTIVAVGERGWNGSRGRVRAYSYNGSDWTEIGSPTAMTGENASDNAGWSVAIRSDGTIVAVGELGWDGVGADSGRVRMYQYTAGNWTEIGSPTAMTGENVGDGAGQSVAISSDGTKVAVGEYGWSGGNSSGRVRVYQYTNDNWSEIGSATAMTGENDFDEAGWSVAMSSNGTVVAVGERSWSGGNSNGRVRVYQFPLSDNVKIIVDIVNMNLASVSHSDISRGTTPGHATQTSSPGQGAITYGANISAPIHGLIFSPTHNIFNLGQ